MSRRTPIMHLRVERVFYGQSRFGSTHARACDPVLTVLVISMFGLGVASGYALGSYWL